MQCVDLFALSILDFKSMQMVKYLESYAELKMDVWTCFYFVLSGQHDSLKIDVMWCMSVVQRFDWCACCLFLSHFVFHDFLKRMKLAVQTLASCCAQKNHMCMTVSTVHQHQPIKTFPWPRLNGVVLFNEVPNYKSAISVACPIE